MKGNISKQEEKLFKVFSQGLQHYFNMDWDAATEYFIESSRVERFPENQISPSNVYIKRCEKYKKYPPAALNEKWDRISKAYQREGVTQE
jgi:hypothetical protein